MGGHRTELERAGDTQQIVPIAGNEVRVDAVASDAVQRSVVGARIDPIEARLAQILSRDSGGPDRGSTPRLLGRAEPLHF